MQSKYSRIFNITVLKCMSPIETVNYLLIHSRSFIKFNSDRLFETENKQNQTSPVQKLKSKEFLITIFSETNKVMQLVQNKNW